MIFPRAFTFLLSFAVVGACSNGTQGKFEGVNGIQISYVEIETSANTTLGGLVFVPGRGESYLQFCELADDLIGEGYDIYMMDWRGQGLSGRLLEDAGKGHLDNWDYLVDDLKTLVDDFIRPKHDKIVAVGHSMGAAALTTYAETYNDFAAVVLSSPMHQVNTDPYSECVSELIANFFGTFLCQAEEYTIIQGAYDNATDTFEDNKSTHDPVRWQTKYEIFQQFPMGGPTNGYFQTVFPGTRNLRNNAASLTVPILMLQAELDEIVVNSAQDQVCEDAQDCEKHVMTGAFHNIFWELDEIRSVALDTYIRPFLQSA